MILAEAEAGYLKDLRATAKPLASGRKEVPSGGSQGIMTTVRNHREE